MINLSLIFICVAASFNAAMDVVSFHYSTSKFAKLNNQYFDPSVSWKNKYIDGEPSKGRKKWFFGLINKPVAFTDFWHLMKSLMVIFICASISLFKTDGLVTSFVAFCVMGIFWNLTFNLFYNNILKK